MTPPAGPRLAVFDLDGTLTRHDTFGGFVLAALRRWPLRVLRAPLLLVPLAGFALRLLDRGGLKGAVMRALLAGLTRAQVADLARRYAAHVAATQLHQEILTLLATHRAAGDHLVLLSASPDLYVPLIGEQLGFDEVQCTAVRWNGERLDGRLAGPNCRDVEKSRRLAALRAMHPGRPAIAYGNSGADLDHMRRCEAAVYVNPSSRLARELAGGAIRPVWWR